MATTRPTRTTLLGWVALALIVGWSTSIAYVLHSALGYNVVSLPLEKESQLYLWAPQGWKFFTRDPHEESASFYSLAGGQWTPLQRDSAASLDYLFGISRKGRALQMEAAFLIDRIPAEAWSHCGGDPAQGCLAAATLITVRNPAPRPEVCGDIGVAMTRPVPWAWRRSTPSLIMPSRIARIHVQC